MNIQPVSALIGAALIAVSAIGCNRDRTSPIAEEKNLANLITISSPEQFDALLVETKGLVLADFWATWCPPCRFMNPILAEVAAEQPETLTIAKVDVDKNRALAERYNIESIPTFILFKEGKAVDMKIGAFPKAELLAWLDANRG